MAAPRAPSCARSSRARSEYRRRRGAHVVVVGGAVPKAALHGASSSAPFERVALAELTSPTGGARLLAAICRHGGVILTTPADGACEATVQACYDACRTFFAQPFDARCMHGAASGPGQLHGYMEYLSDADGGCECFEAKLHHDSRFVWPPQPANFRAAVLALLRLLLSTARDALYALCDALGLERKRVASLLDTDDVLANARRQRAVDFDACSHTALRLWSYTRGRRGTMHVDNTLLTLSPRGSSVGLRVRTLDGAHVFPEASMAPGELFLFAGDALSYLSSGKVPALMHQVVPPPTTPPPAGSPGRPAAEPPRLSAPFFLRGMHSKSLAPPPPLPPLNVALLERNPGNLRSAWPWKRSGPLAQYYQGTEWHEEA